MAKVVNHDERRREILRKAIPVFAEYGYPSVTYLQIAEICGLQRTALYRYFRTKREIFDFAITQLVADIAQEIREKLQSQPNWSALQKLDFLLKHSIGKCLENALLMRAIFEYLASQLRLGEDVRQKILRHTVGYRRAIRLLLDEGIASGEFEADVDAALLEDMLFAQVQASAIRILFYGKEECDSLLAHCTAILNALRKKAP